MTAVADRESGRTWVCVAVAANEATKDSPPLRVRHELVRRLSETASAQHCLMLRSSSKRSRRASKAREGDSVACGAECAADPLATRAIRRYLPATETATYWCIDTSEECGFSVTKGRRPSVQSLHRRKDVSTIVTVRIIPRILLFANDVTKRTLTNKIPLDSHIFNTNNHNARNWQGK